MGRRGRGGGVVQTAIGAFSVKSGPAGKLCG